MTRFTESVVEDAALAWLESPGHLLLLHPKHEVLIVENLVGLDQIRTKRFEFYALPLHIKGATGSPVRAMAVEHE